MHATLDGMKPSIRETLKAAAAELRAAAVETPELDADILLAHVLDRPRTWLFAWPEAPLDTDDRQRFVALIARRCAGHPIAHLVGAREFWSLSLQISEETLIPRPETELLVERALALGPTDCARVADLGTGSGAIAAALATERPGWTLVATDRQAATLAIAGQNFHRLGLDNVQTRHGDWLAPLGEPPFDLIVSNPPYIAARDPHLATGDVRFEPTEALVADDDGLADLRTIINDSPRHLVAGGSLVVEHGATQGGIVRALFVAAGFSGVQTTRDLARHERVTEGTLSGKN